MSAAAPWSVKGIDPKTREVAKDLARRSGMTLGEWLSYMIADSDEDDGYTPLSRRPHAESAHDRRSRARRLDDAYGTDTSTSALAAIEALSARIEGAERRNALAIDGVDRAVAGLVRRLEETDASNATRDRRIDELSDAMREGRGRLRRFEDEVGPRQAEAFGKIEEAIGKLAGRFYEAEARGRDAQTALRDRMDRFERDSSPERLAEAVVERVAARLGEAQNRTAESMRRLEGSFADLDRRIAGVERGGGREASSLEKLAETLSRKVEDSRAEMLRRLDGAAHDGRIDKIERALSDLGQHVQESERRSAQALESMGREVLRIAENLNGRMHETERRQADILTESQERALKAVETMGQELSKSLGSDVARVADAIEHRLRRADEQHALGLEKLGGEIARISERLAERIAQGERRAAQGVDELAEKLNRASEKMESRYDRASGELAERMRQSEERTAKLLAEARESIDKQLAKRSDPPAGGDWRDQAFPQETFEADWQAPAASFAPEQLDPGFPAADAPFADPVFEEPAPSFGERTGFAQVAPAPAEPGFDVEDDFAPQAHAEAAAVTPVFGQSDFAQAEPAAAFADPAADLDSFEAADEFVTDRRPRGERPLSTREAIEAARAATRLSDGAADEGESRKGFGFRLGGGKSRLQKRMDKQAKREGSTIRKALAATTTAVLVVGGGAAGVVGYQRLVEEGSAIPGLPGGDGQAELLAASAVAPTTPTITPPPSEAQAEAQTLYDQATPLIEAGDAEGVRLLSRAANLGHPAAQFALARLYETGEAGVTADPAEARRWTERAARGGEVRAMHNLGLYLFEGLGGMRDQTEAARWFRAAAERGLVDSQYNLARLYERGAEGVDPNPAEAYQWYLIASRSGDTGAEAGAARLRADLSATRRLDAEAAAERFEARSVETG
ncbi:hypothetical protein [Brevundimonas sp.]|uniref:hypothetical protein n=1 Tax=Brevundimonas sp. TaxID=1871086 RepID=UPI0025EC1D27|nr:hypothetical protein [Brevundimonas sp.]